MALTANKPFQQVTQTPYADITFCINEPDKDNPKNRTYDLHIRAIVSITGKKIVKIHLPEYAHYEGIPSRALWAIQQLLIHLTKEGYTLAYNPTEVTI